MIRPLACAGLAALAASLHVAVDFETRPVQGDAPVAADSIEDLAARLKAGGDQANPDMIQALAGKRTRAAMEALLATYDQMKTTYMRREVVRALAQFDDVADAEQSALQRLTDVATQASEPELRRAALDGLGQCRKHGKNFLGRIVDSQAEDSVREYAMELHVTLSNQDDVPWYHEVYKPTLDGKGERDHPKKENRESRDEAGGKKKETEDSAARKAHRSNPAIRGFAFDALSKDLDVDEIVQATGDSSFRIRGASLVELDRRGDKRALELAQTAFEKITPLDSEHMVLKVNERVEVRIIAARVYSRLSGLKVAPELVKRATNPETPTELRRAIAEILAGFNDPSLNRELLGELGKGRTHEKLFRLWAVSRNQDGKVDKAVERLLSDKADEVVIAACRVLADRKDADAEPLLEKLVKGKDRGVTRAALDAIAVLRRGDPTWLDELLGFAKNQDPELRNLALQALGQIADKSCLPKLIDALNDPNWSTRLAALEALENLKFKETITAIIARMGQEDGRMREEFANSLWRLTGQPFQDQVKDWDHWWRENSAGFQILDEAQLERVRAAERDWQLKQTTRVVPILFGLRIISHRVIFIVDISGSMNEELRSDYEGKTGHTRMDVARRELMKCIQGLDPAAFFNLISFSDGVSPWLEGSLAAAGGKRREDARAYLAKLGASGGTNLYGALKLAFADPEVDTIFLMSDGEPSVGEETDQAVIRDRVRQWNEHRGIVINTIAVAGQFQILQWLAADSGGTYVRFQ